MKRTWLATLLALSLATVSQAWPVKTNSVNVDIDQQQDVQFEIPQGETRVILVNWQTNGANTTLTNFTGKYLYQYQGMTNWYSITGAVDEVEGTLSIPWGPDYDPGRSKYLGWATLEFASNPTYRLQIDLKMLETPGFVPNAGLLALDPVDFDNINATGTLSGVYLGSPMTTNSPSQGWVMKWDTNGHWYAAEDNTSTGGVAVASCTAGTGLTDSGTSENPVGNLDTTYVNAMITANPTVTGNVADIAYLLATQIIHTAQIGSNDTDIAALFSTQIVHTAQIGSNETNIVTLEGRRTTMLTWRNPTPSPAQATIRLLAMSGLGLLRHQPSLRWSAQ